MRNKKAIVAAALIAPALALTGGLAYASTAGSPAPATRPAVTTTVQAHSQHTTGQARHDRCDWRSGGHRCDRRDHATQRQVTQRQVAQRQVTRHYSHRTDHGYQGGWGYQGGHGGEHHGDGCGW